MTRYTALSVPLLAGTAGGQCLRSSSSQQARCVAAVADAPQADMLLGPRTHLVREKTFDNDRRRN